MALGEAGDVGAALDFPGGDGEKNHEEEINDGCKKVAAEKEKVLRGEILDKGKKSVELNQEGDRAVF